MCSSAGSPLASRGSHVHKAFADDVGIVLEDIRTQLPAVVRILTTFGSISGMKINVEKTMGMPFWPCDIEEARRMVGAAAPSWSTLPLRFRAVYLG